MNSASQVFLSLFQQHFGAIWGYTAGLTLIVFLLLFGGGRFDSFVNYALSAWFASVMTYIAKAEGLPMADMPPGKPTVTGDEK